MLRSSAKGLVASLQRQLGDPWTCSVGDGPDLRTSGLGPDRDGEVVKDLQPEWRGSPPL